ncbi:MAG: hypothetical protein SWK90_14230 [Chloroflexota bacterium]|nr:hypothetical protein [Chloroflexota bacterium]
MRLETGRRMGMRVVETLAPGCVRAKIAGSVRRGKRECKDIEIVYIAQMGLRVADLFGGTEEYSVADGLIEGLVEKGYWRRDEEVKRWGSKYKRVVLEDIGYWGLRNWELGIGERVVVELFRAVQENWGLVLALRTGPAEFNHLLVNRFGGAMPADMCMRDGSLWRMGRRVETPTEEVFFGELGVPCWGPGERSAARLGRWLWERRGRTRGQGDAVV